MYFFFCNKVEIILHHIDAIKYTIMLSYILAAQVDEYLFETDLFCI